MFISTLTRTEHHNHITCRKQSVRVSDFKAEWNKRRGTKDSLEKVLVRKYWLWFWILKYFFSNFQEIDQIWWTRFPQQPPVCSHGAFHWKGKLNPQHWSQLPWLTVSINGFINFEALGTLTLRLKSLISHRGLAFHAGP